MQSNGWILEKLRFCPLRILRTINFNTLKVQNPHLYAARLHGDVEIMESLFDRLTARYHPVVAEKHHLNT